MNSSNICQVRDHTAVPRRSNIEGEVRFLGGKCFAFARLVWGKGMQAFLSWELLIRATDGTSLDPTGGAVVEV